MYVKKRAPAYCHHSTAVPVDLVNCKCEYFLESHTDVYSEGFRRPLKDCYEWRSRIFNRLRAFRISDYLKKKNSRVKMVGIYFLLHSYILDWMLLAHVKVKAWIRKY